MAYICCYKIVKIMDDRYQLLSKEVKYIINFVSNWEVLGSEIEKYYIGTL